MIEAQRLKEIAGLAHGFFTREGGCSTGLFASLNCGFGSGDDRENVARNRAIVAARLHVAAPHLLTVYQQHSPRVVTVKAPWPPEAAPIADAMVTATPALALGALTADCAPVVFADRGGKAVGIAHAGWKGALSGVLEATVDAMEALGCDRGSIIAAIGPAISAAAYEVGPEFQHRFLDADGANAAFFVPAPKNGHFMFDLPAYVAARLAAKGIADVESLSLCTYAGEKRFFSYRRATHRREPHYGRLMSAISILG